MDDQPDRPILEYPCAWTYKVVGTDEAEMRHAVKVMLTAFLDKDSGERPYELSLSQTSSGGKYVSLNLTLEVRSEEERDALHAGLKDCPEVVMVL